MTSFLHNIFAIFGISMPKEGTVWFRRMKSKPKPSNNGSTIFAGKLTVWRSILDRKQLGRGLVVVLEDASVGLRFWPVLHPGRVLPSDALFTSRF